MCSYWFQLCVSPLGNGRHSCPVKLSAKETVALATSASVDMLKGKPPFCGHETQRPQLCRQGFQHYGPNCNYRSCEKLQDGAGLCWFLPRKDDTRGVLPVWVPACSSTGRALPQYGQKLNDTWTLLPQTGQKEIMLQYKKGDRNQNDTRTMPQWDDCISLSLACCAPAGFGCVFPLGNV